MIKKHIKAIVLFLLALTMWLAVVLVSGKHTDGIYISEKNSYFSHFWVEDDRVYIQCYLTLVNELESDKTVHLSARLPEDVAGGLLKAEVLSALQEDGTAIDFVVPAKGSESFAVVFVGEFGGTEQKRDKNLPEIQIEIAE